MKENNKNKGVPATNDDNQDKKNNKGAGTSLKLPVTGSDVNEVTAVKTELPESEHEHDYKVPVGQQNRPNKKHDQSDNIKGNIVKSRNSSQGFNTNKKQGK